MLSFETFPRPLASVKADFAPEGRTTLANPSFVHLTGKRYGLRMRAAIFTGLLLLAGCTTAKTMMLDDRTAMISGRDIGWGDAGSVRRKVLKTAAEMAQARGYQYFQIVSAEDTTKRGYVPIAGQSTTNTTGSAYCYGAWCSGQATSHTNATPGYLAPYTQAGSDVVIRFYRANEAPSTAYSAVAILSQK